MEQIVKPGPFHCNSINLMSLKVTLQWFLKVRTWASEKV